MRIGVNLSLVQMAVRQSLRDFLTSNIESENGSNLLLENGFFLLLEG